MMVLFFYKIDIFFLNPVGISRCIAVYIMRIGVIALAKRLVRGNRILFPALFSMVFSRLVWLFFEYIRTCEISSILWRLLLSCLGQVNLRLKKTIFLCPFIG